MIRRAITALALVATRTITALALAATPAMASAQAGMARAEQALNLPPSGQPAPYIDPGPANIPMTGTFLIRLLPAAQVRAICPAAIDWHSIGCTTPISRVITMPDEESSGLSTDQWLRALRHEMLHAMGIDDFHGPRP
ncbi:hypothetical protein O4H52_03240 [Sphingomonadaceae bacterium G21617-S1]|nr:hypothetical protein [Sphingomonadaceae bacterium G21617-S1]